MAGVEMEIDTDKMEETNTKMISRVEFQTLMVKNQAIERGAGLNHEDDDDNWDPNYFAQQWLYDIYWVNQELKSMKIQIKCRKNSLSQRRIY